MIINYITSSLLNSWLFYLNNPNAKFDNFLKILKREKFERTEAMQKGIDFEEKVWKGEFQEFKNYIEDALWQVDIEGRYKDILIVGKIDLLHIDYIYDIKHTKKYKPGKYFNSSQHLIYPYCTEIENFKYLVWDGELHIESYIYKKGQLEKLIDEFIVWLKATQLYHIWLDNWRKERNEI